MPMSKIKQVWTAREGSRVERCHALPHKGSYSNGYHQYNVTSMVLILHPNPSMRLIRACMFHDTVERWSGDVPGFVKEYESEFAAAEKKLEAAIVSRLPFVPKPDELTDEERIWLKACDMLEFYLWILDELAGGNTYPLHKARRIKEWFERAARDGKLPLPVQQVYLKGHIVVGDYIDEHGRDSDHRSYPPEIPPTLSERSPELDGERLVPAHDLLYGVK